MCSVLKEIFIFYESSVSEFDIKIDVLRCLSSIIVNNSTVAPTNDSLSDSNARRVSDRKWVNNVLLQSGLFQSLCELFQQLVSEFESFLQASNIVRTENFKEANSTTNNNNDFQYNNNNNNDDFNDNDELEMMNRHNSQSSVNTSIDLQEVGSIATVVKEVLRFFIEICHDEEIASNLFEYSLANSLLQLIKITTTVRDTFLASSIDILWTMLETYLASTAVSSISSSSTKSSSSSLLSQKHSSFNYNAMDLELAVSVLTNALNYKLETSSVPKDKECRNDVLIVLSILLRIPHNSKFPSIISLFLKYNTVTLMLAYSMMAETNNLSIIQLPVSWKPVKSHFDSATEQDLEFKRLLWIALSSILSMVLKERADRSTTTTTTTATTGGGTSGKSNEYTQVPSEYTHVLLDIVISPLLSVMLTYLDLDPETSLTKTMTLATGQQSALAFTMTSLSDPDSPFHNHTKTMNSTMPIQSNSVSENTYFRRLAKYQLYELQNQASKFIASHVVRTTEMLEEFINLQGFSRILNIIERYVVSEQPEHKAIMLTCLGLFQDCFQTAVDTKSVLLGSPLMYLLLLIVERNPDQSLRTLAAHIISILCKNDVVTNLSRPSPSSDVHPIGTTADITTTTTTPPIETYEVLESWKFTTASYQDMFEHEGGIQLCLSLLEDYCRPRVPAVGNKAGLNITNHFTLPPSSEESTILTSTPINDRALPEVDEEVSMFWVAVVTALWNGITNNPRNLMTFGTNSGIDIILALLETSTSFAFRILLLRLLSDTITISNTTAASFSEKSIFDIVNSQKYLLSIFHAWKSIATFRSSTRLLLHIWLDEEVRLGVIRPKGIIKDVYYPLGVSTITATVTAAAASTTSTIPAVSNDTKVNNTNNNEQSQSSTVTKLNSMILQSRRTQSAGTITRDIQQQGLINADIRGIIANLFLVAGIFDGKTIIDDVNLYKRCIYDEVWHNQALAYINSDTQYAKYQFSHSELQVLSLARRYGVFKHMYGWIEVMSKLNSIQITPVEADQEVIDRNYFYSLEAAQIVLKEQTEIYMKRQHNLLEEEQKLHTNIIIQKQNDKKAETLKEQALFKSKQVKKALKTKMLYTDNYVPPPPDDNDKDVKGKGSSNDIPQNRTPNKQLSSYDDLAEDSSMLM